MEEITLMNNAEVRKRITVIRYIIPIPPSASGVYESNPGDPPLPRQVGLKFFL
jgi:hypothetical protein